MMITGFKSYCVYIFIKQIHFKNNNFNVMTLKKTPLEKKLINSWNNKRRKIDGLKFQAIEKKCNKIKPLALLYASYYIKTPDFYIQDIFDDDFETYKENISELKLLEQVFTNDLKDVILKTEQDNIRIKELFISNNSIPKIFKMGLSINSLVIMNDIFGILDMNKELEVNSLEKGRWKNVKTNLIWYKPIIQNYLDEHNWKLIVKDILQK